MHLYALIFLNYAFKICFMKKNHEQFLKYLE